MKKILVTGSNGLLGQKLTDDVLKNRQFELIATGKGVNRHPVKEGYTYEEMDITNKNSIASVVRKHHPDAIINTAAMTNVDTCESQREECWLLNVTAVEYLADLCREEGIQ